MTDSAATVTATAAPFQGRTAWIRSLAPPVRDFLRTETGGAAVLVAATVLALLWANIDSSSYEKVWTTTLSIRLGGGGISMDLREWVNSGLMTFFFLVVGLEARREFDLGELRDRRRLALPVAAAVGGMVVPIAIYLAINAGHSSVSGWGAAMSTDTAFALGMLALVGRRFPATVRTFILTVAVADDLVAFAVIVIAYTTNLRVIPLIIGLTAIALIVMARMRSVRNGSRVLRLRRLVAWVAFLKSGRGPRDRRRDRRADRRSPIRPTAPTSSGRPTCSGCSASSQPSSTPRPCARACAPRSRRTSASSRSTTRSRATWWCPCSGSPTRAS